MTATSTLPATKLRRAPLPVSISAWATPALVLSGFALVAVIPVTVLVISAFRNGKARGLRWYAALVGVLYAAPLLIWALNPDRAQSLTKDMNPVFLWLIVAASAVLLIKIATRRKR